MEQEWKEKQEDKAKTLSKLDTDDNSNKKEEWGRKATKPNKGKESSMENLGGSQGLGAISKPTCDLNRVMEWAEEQLVHNSKKKGTIATKPKKSMCDLTLDPAPVEEKLKLSTLRPRTTLFQEALWGAEAATHVPSLASVDEWQHRRGSVAA